MDHYKNAPKPLHTSIACYSVFRRQIFGIPQHRPQPISNFQRAQMRLTSETERERFLATAEAARRLGVSARTLEKWRIKGNGPIYRKFGRKVLYSIGDLEHWAEAQRRTSTADQGLDPKMAVRLARLRGEDQPEPFRKDSRRRAYIARST